MMKIVMMMLLVAAVGMCSAKPVSIVESALDAPITNCGQPSDHLHITAFSLDPPTPVKGQPLTLNITGHTDEAITNGTASVHIKYGIISVINKSFDICTISPNVTCPLPQANFSISKTIDIPDKVPSGHYTGEIKATDQTGTEILCLDLDLHLK